MEPIYRSRWKSSLSNKTQNSINLDASGWRSAAAAARSAPGSCRSPCKSRAVIGRAGHYCKNNCMIQVWLLGRGLARTQTPTRINCVPELPTFGVIAGVSPTEVQWESLFLEKPPSFFLFHKIYYHIPWGVRRPKYPLKRLKLIYTKQGDFLLNFNISEEWRTQLIK